MEQPQKVAVLDLGSNSFHMMICQLEDDRYAVIDRVREAVRLRFGLQEDGSITKEAQERALDCLTRFEQRLRGVDTVRIVGTNTLRRAKNPGAFLKKIEKILKTPVEVIGGMEEARLIYLGVASTISNHKLRNFVIDIGGGSTEFIIGKGPAYHVRETRPMGCVAFSMEFFPENVPTKKRLHKAVLRVRQELEAYQQSLHKKNWDRCIGASGTIKAIASVCSALGAGELITLDGLDRIQALFKWGIPLEKISIPGLREDRYPVFLGGYAVLRGIFEVYQIESMEVSANSMREGLLLDLIDRGASEHIREKTVDRLMSFYSVDHIQAERVKKTALNLFPQVMGNAFKRREEFRRMLGWACDLHEIGLAIAHSGYHKHGAYILQNGDLDGFSQVEQCVMAFLVLNHRKRLKTNPLPYGIKAEWSLVLVLRLAFILNRERIDATLPDVAITWYKHIIEVFIDPEWLDNHPMTQLDLEGERSYWNRINYKFLLNGEEA